MTSLYVPRKAAFLVHRISLFTLGPFGVWALTIISLLFNFWNFLMDTNISQII